MGSVNYYTEDAESCAEAAGQLIFPVDVLPAHIRMLSENALK